MQERFARAIARHRLRREIIATATTNSLVNRMGPTFVPRAQEDTGAEPAQIARAYTAAREIFAMREVWAQIEALDNKVPAKLQYEAAFQTSRLLRHATYWLLSARAKLQVDAAVAEFRDGVRRLEADVPTLLTGAELTRFEEGRKHYLEAGLPPALAARIASLEALNAALDIVEIARGHKVGVSETARVYFEVGTRSRLRLAAGAYREAHRRRAMAGDRAHRPARRRAARATPPHRAGAGTQGPRQRPGARHRLGGVGRQGPGALAAHAGGHARRRRRRLRHAHRGRRVGPQARPNSNMAPAS